VTGRLALIIAVAIVGAGCAPGASDQVDSTSGATIATSTSQPVTTGTTDTSLPPEEAPVGSGRPEAPDFTLELGDGGTYTLSEGERPVYLVFWAEW